MNILVIPEDFRKDQYILKPLISRLLRHLGTPSPRVVICKDPLLGGIGEALKADKLEEIVSDQMGMTDLFILCVDRDGEAGRRQRLEWLEAEFKGRCVFLAQDAWEEIETWVLAGLDLPDGWRWPEVRAEKQVKEKYFEPLAERRGLSRTLGGGRDVLGREASRRIRSVRQRCRQDFDALALRLQATLAQQ